MKWEDHLELLKRCDRAEIHAAFPELSTTTELFWVAVYSAIILLTEDLPPLPEELPEHQEELVTPWYMLRGKAEVYLGRKMVKLYRHTKQYEFRGRLYPVLRCLLEGHKTVDDTQLRNLSMDEIRRAVSMKNHTLHADMTVDQILSSLTDEAVTKSAIDRGQWLQMLRNCPWNAIEAHLFGVSTDAILGCVAPSHIAEYLRGGKGFVVISKEDAESINDAMFKTIGDHELVTEYKRRKDESDIESAAIEGDFFVDGYQDFTDTTWSSPADAERWNALLPSCLQMIENMAEFLEMGSYDAVKKFCAYGRTPAGGHLINQFDEYHWRVHTPDAFGIQPAKSEELSHPVVELIHAMFGLLTEIEELCRAVVKNVGGYRPSDDPGTFVLSMIDGVNVCEELGDAQYYMARIARVFKTKMSTILTQNRKKLSDKKAGRYRQGIFNAAEANNRDLAAERTLLESPAYVSMAQECADSIGQSVASTVGAIAGGSSPYELAAQSGIGVDPLLDGIGTDQVNGIIHDPDAFCAYCNKKGHLLPNCPERAEHLAEAAQGDNDAVPLTEEEIALGQQGRRTVEESTSPLDQERNRSTIDPQFRDD